MVLPGIAAVLLGGLTLAHGGPGDSSSRAPKRAAPAYRGSPTPRLEVRADQHVLLVVPVSAYVVGGRVQANRLRPLLRRALPAAVVTSRTRARITYRYDVQATAARVTATGSRGGRVEAVRRPVAAVVGAPVVQQAAPNTCESAALAILLATTGREVGQRRLQAAFPRSGPLDPRGTGVHRVWGDPDKGYVGRANGGGVAGGFGVYPRPVRATALRFGVRLRDLSGRSPKVVYEELLAGHAVMAWVGLSAGPRGEWRTPDGKSINVNFGEHTVVVHGLRRDGTLIVSNPLRGTREIWSKDKFESMWRLLGRRMLAT
jgi:uncharacterized protein YvpB